MSREIRDLIRQMSRANPLWGASRIHGELLKLGIEVSQATVSRYLPWRPKAPSPTWRSFLQNHSLIRAHSGGRTGQYLRQWLVQAGTAETFQVALAVGLLFDRHIVGNPG
jgi:hypothetical protein